MATHRQCPAATLTAVEGNNRLKIARLEGVQMVVLGQNFVRVTKLGECDTERAMLTLLTKILLALRSLCEVRAAREAEILVLRQQLLVLSRKSSKRVRLRNIDRLILVLLSRLFPSVLDAIVIVKPETVLRWHRRGFRAYWRWKSWRRGGRPRIDRELRQLIRRMSRDNPLWGAPRLHGEVLMLGIDVSESTVGRYMIRIGRPRSQGWKTFLRNQAAGIASIDLFVVRTISFKLLYGLLILRHTRRCSPLSPVGFGLAASGRWPVLFSQASATIYLAADVLHRDQKAGCVEQAWHIRLL